MMTGQPNQKGSGLMCIGSLLSFSIGRIFNYSLGIWVIKIHALFDLLHIHSAIASHNTDLQVGVIYGKQSIKGAFPSLPVFKIFILIIISHLYSIKLCRGANILKGSLPDRWPWHYMTWSLW